MRSWSVAGGWVRNWVSRCAHSATREASRGDFDDGAHGGLRAAGVRFAFSYYGGIRAFDDWDDYDIRRIAVEPYVADDLFRAVVSLPRFFSRPTGSRRR